MSKNEGLYTDGSSAFTAKVNQIPLKDVDSAKGAENSIGDLVSNATAQMSSLVRSEIELAKAELAGEVKKGAIGGGLFVGAGAIALYSTFFFFIFLAELLRIWLASWAAYLIIFVVMIMVASIFAFIGFKRISKIRAPQKTIESVSELKKLRPGEASKNLAKDDAGLYT